MLGLILMEKPFFRIISIFLFALKAFSLEITPSFPKIQDEVCLLGEGYKENEDVVITFEKKPLE